MKTNSDGTPIFFLFHALVHLPMLLFNNYYYYFGKKHTSNEIMVCRLRHANVLQGENIIGSFENTFQEELRPQIEQNNGGASTTGSRKYFHTGIVLTRKLYFEAFFSLPVYKCHNYILDKMQQTSIEHYHNSLELYVWGAEELHYKKV